MRRRPDAPNTRLRWVRALLLLAIAALLSACAPRDPLERARILQDDQGDFETSLSILRDLVEERPDEAEVQFRYGIALVATQQTSLAKWPLLKAMESPDWLLRAAIPLAQFEILLGRHDEAIQALDRALEAHPDEVPALLLRAEARIRSRRDIGGALADAERLLELDPDNTAIQPVWIAALLGLDRADEAAQALDDFESRHRDDALGLHGSPLLCAAQATFRYEKGEVEEAESAFERCLEIFPQDGELVGAALKFFDAVDKSERSEEILQTVLESSPDSVGIRANLFDRLRAAGREEEAEALLRGATELEAPEDASSGWYALGLLQLRKGEVEEAVSSFSNAQRLDASNSSEILFSYADSLVVAGRYDEALRLADALSVPAYRLLVRARVALAKGEPARALELFTRANQVWPDNAVARYYTAVAAEQLGDFERAVEDYRYSMRIDSQTTDAYLRLARLQHAAGAREAALQSLTFRPGARPSEEEAGLLIFELSGRVGRPPPPWLQSRFGAKELRGSALAALARGVWAEKGPEAAAKLIKNHPGAELSDPLEADALEVLIDALAATGKAQQALTRAEAGLARAPEAAAFHALHGRALGATGVGAAAERKAYRRALEIDPEERRSLLGLARLDARAGELEDALAYLERALELDPANRAAQREAAELEVRLGRGEAAEERLAALLRDHPYDAPAALALAELRLERGAGAASVRELVRRAKRFGRREEAEALLQRLAEAAPAAS